MTNRTMTAALALATLLVTTSLASAAVVPPKTQPKPHTEQSHHGIVDLECKMKGFDFWIINFGSENVDSGRQVEWSSPSTEDGNIITLPKMLAPGEELRLGDVLSDVPVHGAPCQAAFA
jgi:hypothetical protein